MTVLTNVIQARRRWTLRASRGDDGMKAFAIALIVGTLAIGLASLAVGYAIWSRL